MSGHRNLNELLARMSPVRRARVKTEADTLHREYVLSQIRQRLGFTQAEIAEFDVSDFRDAVSAPEE